MVEIIKINNFDDAVESKTMSIKVCSSVEKAEETILSEINDDFDGNWNSLKDASDELSEDISSCVWDEKNHAFCWEDNGKGCIFIICEIDTNKIDGEYQSLIAF